MIARTIVLCAVLGISYGAFCLRAESAAIPVTPVGTAYLDVNFTAGIRDTTRDTTVIGGTVSPTSSASLSAALMDASSMMAAGTATSLPMIFSLYPQLTGDLPAALWSDTIPAVPIDANGNVHVVLGTHKPLNAVLFASGERLYLEIWIAGEKLTPRVELVTPGNVLMINVVGPELQVVSGEGPSANDVPLMLATGRSSAGAVAMSRRPGRGRAIVLGDRPVAGQGWSTAMSQAQMMYRLEVQESLIQALRAEVARLQMPPDKKRPK